MIQVWTMPGLHGTRGDDDPLAAMSALLDEAGYTSVVATNCDQVYLRPVRSASSWPSRPGWWTSPGPSAPRSARGGS